MIGEVLEAMARMAQKQAQLIEDDAEALKVKVLYPKWDKAVGKTVTAGFKFMYNDKLYKTIQPELTILAQYVPGTGTESLYTEVCETHAGTLEDPIPYSGNMALENGKYYMQDYVIYLCNRDTGAPVYNTLAEMVDIYVKEA